MLDGFVMDRKEGAYQRLGEQELQACLHQLGARRPTRRQPRNQHICDAVKNPLGGGTSRETIEG